MDEFLWVSDTPIKEQPFLASLAIILVELQMNVGILWVPRNPELQSIVSQKVRHD